MEVNSTAQHVEMKTPSLFGMIISPGLQFERMKKNKKIWGGFFVVALLQGLLGGLKAYVIHNSPDMLKINKEFGELVEPSSFTTTVVSGIASSFVSAMIGILFLAAIYKMFMLVFMNDTPYKTVLNIVVYANSILIIGELINTTLSLIFGTGMIQYTNLSLLFTKGTFAHGIGNALETFYIWNLVLIWIGLHITAGLSKIQSVIPIIVIFLVRAAFITFGTMILSKFM